MKMNKKISALLSCILACSSINPASAARISDYENSEYDDDDQIDENESQENENNAPWLKPLLYTLGAFGTAYAGYKGVQIGRSYHARNMLKGKAWGWTMSEAKKKLLCETVLAMKYCRAHAPTTNYIDSYLNGENQNKNDTNEYLKLQFNLSKLTIFDVNFLKEIVDRDGENNPMFTPILLVYNMLQGKDATVQTTITELLKESEIAVGYMNDFFKGRRTIENLSQQNKKLLEKSKQIIEFMDKIGPTECIKVIRNCGLIQIDKDGTQYTLSWIDNPSDMLAQPRATLHFNFEES